MTDARTDALTAPTADPGIVAALVYVGDQIAAIAAGSDRNRPRSAEQAKREGLGGHQLAATPSGVRYCRTCSTGPYIMFAEWPCPNDHAKEDR